MISERVRNVVDTYKATHVRKRRSSFEIKIDIMYILSKVEDNERLGKIYHICNMNGQTHGVTKKFLEDLEESGLVYRADGADKRSNYTYKLTPKGYTVLGKFDEIGNMISSLAVLKRSDI
jgi:predicted transcriptional regulator